MSHEHHHHDHDHGHDERQASSAVVPEVQDAGSQALSEALRSSFAVVKIVMVLMVLVFIGSGFFQVGPSEKAVILRFGKPVGEGQKALLTSGLHWSFPYPIDEVVKIPISKQQTITSTIGWYFTTPEQELSGEELPAGPSLNPAIDGYVITGDRNIIHSRAILTYTVNDPVRYVFDFVSASNALQNILNNALLYTAAHYKVDDALFNDTTGFRKAVEQRVSEMADEEKLGIVVEQISDMRSIPPRQLKSVFDQVITTRENRNRVIDDAKNYANTNLNAASSTAFAITNQAEAARVEYVSSMIALATNFSAQLPYYKLNPTFFRQQQLGDVMAKAFANVQRKIFVPQRADGKPTEVRLLISDQPPQPKTSANP
ncbi:MAG TPA: protease modulator HflK [Verrucomicrobiae bacterium]|jgi:membrane protease subunit HflK